MGCGSVVQGLPTMCKTLVLVTGGGERMEEEKGKGEREWEEGDYSQPPADGFNARPLVTLCFSTNEEV